MDINTIHLRRLCFPSFLNFKLLSIHYTMNAKGAQNENKGQNRPENAFEMVIYYF